MNERVSRDIGRQGRTEVLEAMLQDEVDSVVKRRQPKSCIHASRQLHR
jgi:hypothetical protein